MGKPVKAAILAMLLALQGCAANPPACTFGVMVFGPLPLPYADCGITVEATTDTGRQRPGRHGKLRAEPEPEDDEDDEDEDGE